MDFDKENTHGKREEHHGPNNIKSALNRKMAIADDYGTDFREHPAHNETLPVNFLPREYGSHIKQLQGLSQWVNGLKVFEKDNLIVAWRKENPSDSEESHATRISRIRPTKD